MRGGVRAIRAKAAATTVDATIGAARYDKMDMTFLSLGGGRIG